VQPKCYEKEFSPHRNVKTTSYPSSCPHSVCCSGKARRVTFMHVVYLDEAFQRDRGARVAGSEETWADRAI
jgi:hypothetical protein